jgi:transcriptional antiterminator RfaH
VLRPLFPGYVFIHIDPERDRWRPILSTIGVRTIIRFGETIGALPESFVDSLRAREEDGAIPVPRPREYYSPGQKVLLREGPLDGLIATVLLADDKERLLVLMQILKRSVRVSVPVDSVVPA